MEFRGHRKHAVHTTILTDANVHNARWLRYSAGPSTEGTELRNICYDLNLEQRITQPTRGEYLLDLVLTDVPHLHTSVEAEIADHRVVLASLAIEAPCPAEGEREVWHFANADWVCMCEQFAETDWAFIDCATHTEAVEKTATKHPS